MIKIPSNQKDLFYSKEKEDEKPVPIEQMTKFLLSVASEFDAKYQEVFINFYHFNNKTQTQSQNYGRKQLYQISKTLSEKLQPFIRKGQKQLFIKPSSKSLKRQIEIPYSQIPPKTKIYKSLNCNLRLDEHQYLESMIGPRSLDSICKKQDFDVFEEEKTNIRKLDPIPLESILKLEYLIKRFQKQFGLKLNHMRTLGAFLDLKVTGIGYFWFKEAKKALGEPSGSQRKIYTQKYIRFFCNICQIYACNFHFLNKEDYLPEDDENAEYSNYDSLNKFPKKQLYFQNFIENIKVPWVQLYRCSKESKSYCWRQLDQRVDISQIEPIHLKKYQKELIYHCMTYNMISPCFLYLLCKSQNPQDKNTPCLAYYIYIMQNGLMKKRDEIITSIKNWGDGDNKSFQNEKNNQIKKNAINTKKLWKNKNWNRDQDFIEYIPCFHEGLCSEECYCIKNRGYCEKYCCCSLFCENRFKGCSCSNGDCCQQTCECFESQRECDPDVCFKCNSKNNKHLIEIFNVNMPVCNNSNLSYRVKRRLVLGKSTLCDGLGIFAGQNFKSGDFIGEYLGEVLTVHEAEKRGNIYSLMGVYYLFTLNNNNIIDAYMYGNKCRFINHGSFGLDNATVKIMFCQGEHKIGIYAQKEIVIGDEILFDYGNKFNVPWLLEFNEKMKKKHKELLRRKKEKKVLREEIQLFESNGDEEYQFIL